MLKQMPFEFNTCEFCRNGYKTSEAWGYFVIWMERTVFRVEIEGGKRRF